MSRPAPRFALPHLSDEAVAAFADNVLRDGARYRAQQHIGECAECRSAVADQRQARSLLRSAPLPALPGDLLERLRTVPVSAPLPSGPPVVSALSADGQPLFAAFGTGRDTGPAPSSAASPAVSAPASTVPGAPPADRSWAHRHHLPTLGLGVVAAATVMVGALATTAPTAGGGAPAPASPGPVQQRTASPGESDLQAVFQPVVDLTGRR
ncbi:MAG: hypothetical protein ABJA87_04330 [bacterium]